MCFHFLPSQCCCWRWQLLHYPRDAHRVRIPCWLCEANRKMPAIFGKSACMQSGGPILIAGRVTGNPSVTPIREVLPTTRGIDLLGNLHLELRRTVFLGGCWRRWALSLIVVVTTNDGNRTADSRNHCDTRRLAKCAIVSVPTHKAILPCACLRSLTTRAGCGAPCTYKRALSPCTSIFSLVHSPGTTSA